GTFKPAHEPVSGHGTAKPKPSLSPTVMSTESARATDTPTTNTTTASTARKPILLDMKSPFHSSRKIILVPTCVGPVQLKFLHRPKRLEKRHCKRCNYNRLR